MKKGILVVAAVLIAFSVLSLHAEEENFTGDWETAWGPVSLVQKGNEVLGTYAGDLFPGKLSGVVKGNVLSFTWTGDNNEVGKGVFILSADGQSFKGTWGGGGSETDGGQWNGTRVE